MLWLFNIFDLFLNPLDPDLDPFQKTPESGSGSGSETLAAYEYTSNISLSVVVTKLSTASKKKVAELSSARLRIQVFQFLELNTAPALIVETWILLVISLEIFIGGG